jgi:hypothetical protein
MGQTARAEGAKHQVASRCWRMLVRGASRSLSKSSNRIVTVFYLQNAQIQ